VGGIVDVEMARRRRGRSLHAAGIDPRASRDFFERLARSSEGLLDIDEALSWISTHPSHAERIDAIDAQLATLGTPVTRPLDVDWAAVRARLSDDDGASGVPGASPPALPAGARDAAPGGSPSDTAGAPVH
jgi:hypothetical protein